MGSTREVRIEGGHVFVVRLWLEPDGQQTSEESWRGQVSCKNKRRHFVGLKMLFTEMTEMLVVLSDSAVSHQSGAASDEE